jgi:hypothetical protein
MRIPGTCLKSLLLFSVALFLGGCSTSGKVSKETRKPEPQSELMSIFPTEEQIPSLQFPEPPKSVPRDKFALYLGT